MNLTMTRVPHNHPGHTTSTWWLTLALITATASPPATSRATDWPGFRGHGDSIAPTPSGALPLHWSDDTNLLWRVDLPGTGQSSPVLRHAVAYVTSAALPRKESWILQAIDAATGQERWRRTQPSAAPEDISDTHSQAAPTPVVGSDAVFAFFESGDCLSWSHDGDLRWHRVLTRELGPLANNHGLGGSPVLAGDLLVVPLDQEKPSCLVALDRRTGATRWKTSRPGRTAWSTPLFVDDPTSPQLVVSAGGTVTSYRTRDGQPLWELSGLVKNLVPSPTLASSVLVVAAGSKGSNIAYDWKGSTNAPTERWRADDVSSGFASPLLHRGRVYFIGTAGIVHCRDASTGRLLFDERISQSVWASPIGADDRVYLFGEKGSSTVLAASDHFTPLATNRLTVAKKVVGVAVHRNSFLLRTQVELLCLGSKP